MLNQQWLHTFLTLVETGHFTRTAEKLFMTQPGVSQHIRKLEQQIGKPLLNRVGKKFELTRAGQLLVEHGRRQLAQEARFFEALDQDNLFQGACKLACSGAMALRLYPKLLDHQQQHTTLSINLEAAPNARIIEGLLENRFDLGITTQTTHSPQLSEVAVGAETLCVVIPSSKDDGQALSYPKLQQLGFIDHPDGAQYADLLLSKNFPDHFEGVDKLPQHGYVNQISQILLPVAAGLGFTVIQESVVRQFADPSALTIVALKETIREPLYLVSKRHRTLPARYTPLIEQVKSLLQ